MAIRWNPAGIPLEVCRAPAVRPTVLPSYRFILVGDAGCKLTPELAAAFEQHLQQQARFYGGLVTANRRRAREEIPLSTSGYEAMNKALGPEGRSARSAAAALTRLSQGFNFGASVAEALGPEGRTGRAAKAAQTRLREGFNFGASVANAGGQKKGAETRMATASGRAQREEARLAAAAACRGPVAAAAAAAVAANRLSKYVCTVCAVTGEENSSKWRNAGTMCNACYLADLRKAKK
ncbi:hypothetical protein TSOC_006885 [Tetrabaena socialis]|uniref:Uncharacterized protein n=1 Tax=Tetrabaena socialis TaxID=47790 RepID=A0A2J8A2G9_9CHLO|nr:hypothetical protein TSOC_006885 [Tetrabaena socialis]|eukprot:PNH06716.1 hypothetical protein TSOC_006885 [Tetrabaena socialis]